MCLYFSKGKETSAVAWTQPHSTEPNQPNPHYDFVVVFFGDELEPVASAPAKDASAKERLVNAAADLKTERKKAVALLHHHPTPPSKKLNREQSRL